jgi:hypothetical protein
MNMRYAKLETIAACSSNSNNFETILSFSKNHITFNIKWGCSGFFKIIIACQIIDAENGLQPLQQNFYRQK